MYKAEIRESYKIKRAELSSADKNRFDDLMLIHFQTLPIPFLQTFLSYWPIAEKKEVNTHLFSNYLEFLNPGASLLYPKTNWDEQSMYAIQVHTETEFIKNKHNIYEPSDGNEINPEEIDLILVPLLVCDIKGYRVGYGKGFYDKYMMKCRKDCIKIGLSYFEPVDAIDDLHEYDLPLNYCITPQKTYVF